MKSYATLESQLAATHAALSVAEDALATAQAEALRLRRALDAIGALAQADARRVRRLLDAVAAVRGNDGGAELRAIAMDALNGAEIDPPFSDAA